jgi:hypothetical protein
MNKPGFTGLTKEQLKYIEYLESCLNGTADLILELNNLNSILAGEINMICQGNDTIDVKDEESGETVKKSKLILLSPDKDDKTFDKIMKIVDKYDKFKAIGISPKEEIGQRNKLKFNIGDNPFEKVIGDIKSQKNGIKH